MSFLDQLAIYVRMFTHYFLPFATIVSWVVFFALIPETKRRNTHFMHVLGMGLNNVLLLLVCLPEFREWLNIDAWFQSSLFKQQLCDPFVVLAFTLALSGVTVIYTLNYFDSITMKQHDDIYMRYWFVPIIIVNIIVLICWYNHSDVTDLIQGLIYIGFGAFVSPFIGILCYAAGEKCPHCNYFADHEELKRDEKVLSDNFDKKVTHVHSVHRCIHCHKTFTNDYDYTDKKEEIIVY